MLTGGKPTDNMHRKQQSLSTGTAAHSLPSSFFFFKLSVSLSAFSLAPSVSLPLSSLRLLHLYHISSLFFFLHLRSLFLPPPTLVSTPPPSVLSLLSSPAAMWSRRGSGVTEAGPFGVASSLSRLRGAGVPARRVFLRQCASVCVSGALFSRAK